jgi:hypothetical protein
MAQISITLPTARGHAGAQQKGEPGEPYAVRYQPDGSPFAFVWHFFEIEHEDGRSELVCTGAHIQQTRDADAGAHEALTAPVVRDLANRWERLEHFARAALAEMIGFDGDDSPAPLTRGSVRTRRNLSPEFLADVVRRHRGYGARGVAPTQALAREERVSTSTVKNWMRKAQEAGIEEAS